MRLILFSLILMAVSCKKSESSAPSFDALCKQYFDDKNALNPLEATLYGQAEYNDRLELDMTDAYREKQSAFYKKYEEAIAAVDTASLDDEQKLSLGIMQWEVEIGREMLRHRDNLMPINQFEGVHLTMGMLASGESAQPFKTEKDYDNFLKRMEKFAVWIDSAEVYMRKGMASGMVLPKALAIRVAPQFRDMASPKPDQNLFYSAVKKIPVNIPASAKARIEKAYEETITQRLVPRCNRMADFIEQEYLLACRETSGIGSLKGGDALYRTLVKQWTTTNLTPEKIHELGLQEVARLRAEMEKVKKQVGFKGTIKEFFDHVRTRKELMPFTKPEQVIENFESIHSRIKPNVDKLFSLQPKTPFEVRRTEAFREKTASAEYMQGSPDGTRPGIFYVPIPDVTKYNYYADEDLFLHEAIPGHHFQVSLQQENAKLPDFRKFNWFGAYGEGWALYTESLGRELGLYEDPYQYFGMLGSEMHRAIRLVVDTGIHAKGWTREQAIQYSLDNEAESEASIIAEIERYMAIPGQALSYKIGQLKIIELRKRAESGLGKKFDIKAFHANVLESGVLPLELLERKVDRWIASHTK